MLLFQTLLKSFFAVFADFYLYSLKISQENFQGVILYYGPYLFFLHLPEDSFGFAAQRGCLAFLYKTCRTAQKLFKLLSQRQILLLVFLFLALRGIEIQFQNLLLRKKAYQRVAAGGEKLFQAFFKTIGIFLM